tara:strand:+ start:172 stop:522 length:351 start_codon:yes stop_codon:yes gene_type:complete
VSDEKGGTKGETLLVVWIVSFDEFVNLRALSDTSCCVCCVGGCGSGGGGGGGGATYSAVTERARLVSVGDVGTDAAAKATPGAAVGMGRNKDAANLSNSCLSSVMSCDGDPCDLGM